MFSKRGKGEQEGGYGPKSETVLCIYIEEFEGSLGSAGGVG